MASKMLVMILDLTEVPGHRIQFPVPHPPQAVNLLTAFFVCARGARLLSPPPLLSLPLPDTSAFFFSRWCSCLCNLIKIISHSLLFFTFKAIGAISDPKKRLLPKSLSAFSQWQLAS